MEELLARFARELPSSAFTRRKSTETKSRSARNATQSFPSKMRPFWKRKNEKVRIQHTVPSFFASIGDSISVSGPKEARKRAEENKPCAVVLVPSPSVFEDCHGWANALSSAAYLVVIADPDTRESKKLMKALDGVIFSPVPRRLSSAFIVKTRKEALALLEGVKETFPRIVTMYADDTIKAEVAD